MADGGGRVLVVDDFVDTCLVFARLIRRMGHDASCVHSGADALATLRDRPCSLVLLDLMMPGMSGFDVLRAMRDDPSLADVPVVVCSAAERATAWPEAEALGARDYLLKADAAFLPQLEALVRTYAGPPA